MFIVYTLIFKYFQEAFKAVEDIHYLMSLSKRPPKPQTLANFNVKLSLVFWKAENLLFHACARHRLFHLTKDMKKNPSIDDLTRSVVDFCVKLTFYTYQNCQCPKTYL